MARLQQKVESWNCKSKMCCQLKKIHEYSAREGNLQCSHEKHANNFLQDAQHKLQGNPQKVVDIGKDRMVRVKLNQL